MPRYTKRRRVSSTSNWKPKKKYSFSGFGTYRKTYKKKSGKFRKPYSDETPWYYKALRFAKDAAITAAPFMGAYGAVVPLLAKYMTQQDKAGEGYLSNIPSSLDSLQGRIYDSGVGTNNAMSLVNPFPAYDTYGTNPQFEQPQYYQPVQSYLRSLHASGPTYTNSYKGGLVIPSPEDWTTSSYRQRVADTPLDPNDTTRYGRWDA